MVNGLQLPEIPVDERTPLVMTLMEIFAQQQREIVQQQREIVQQQREIVQQQREIVQLRERSHLLLETVQTLKDEIARLKGNNPKPKIKPSKMNKDRGDKTGDRKIGRASCRERV